LLEYTETEGDSTSGGDDLISTHIVRLKKKKKKRDDEVNEKRARDGVETGE